MTSKAAAIRFNYQEALRRASDLDGIAGDLDGARRDVDNSVHQVSTHWKGDSATQCGRKGERLGEQIGASAGAMRSAANEVRRIAQIIYNTEMRNLEIASKRNY